MSEHETDVKELLQRMQQQLMFLEKKLDTLIQQSRPKPFNQERPFSRPFRPYGRPQHRPDQGQSHGPHGHSSHSHGHKKPFTGNRP